MTTPARRSRSASRHRKPPQSPARPRRKLNRPALALVLIAVLAAIPFCIGKYIEFGTPGPFDSGAYVYSAKHILDGAKIGVDEKPSAKVGTLLVNVLGVRLFGFNEVGPELMQTLLQAIALVLMFIAMRKLFGAVPAAVGTIIASVYLSAPLIAKFGNVKEQYMIACMVIGVSCFVLHQLGGAWLYAVLAGAFLIWAPLFKETGVSAVGAVGLFVISQAILKHKTISQTGHSILLLLIGAAIGLAPVCLWSILKDAPFEYWPYARVLQLLFPGERQRLTSYISGSRKVMPFSELAPRVFRYYGSLILPIALAASSIVTRIVRLILSRLSRTGSDRKTIYDRFVLLFAVWWVLDMAFVWISPRSYEQYYLPLNASAAMLSGYITAICYDKAKAAASKPKWVGIGLLGILLMIIMSWHIFFGIAKSPHTGVLYRNPYSGLPQKRRGYAQSLKGVYSRRKSGNKGHWEYAGEYIRNNSAPSDGIYVWGWFPGIYVAAQRLSPAPKAFEGTMHTLSPEALSERIDEILSSFEQQPPKFIVDTHKSHFPWNRPPLELWPRTQKGFLPADEQAVSQYDAAYSKMLREKIEPDEALRYEAMRPFREYVMKNYQIVRTFGQHVLFERK